VSVIARGFGALGYTLQRPLEDRYLLTKSELLNKVSVLLAGRVSEMRFCGDVSTGAGDDLVKASGLARSMVTQFGMSEEVGLAAEEPLGSRYLPSPALPGPKGWSEKTGEKIDSEIRRILEDCRQTAERVIVNNLNFIETCVGRLMEQETL